ncbi:zinc finger, CCHC-type containing protein [Tanacetum coccineum]
MKSQDVAFWKEAINDETDSIMGNNTWVLADLPPGCKPLSCKCIFKRKLKVDGTIEKFKARLVIQGFKLKLRIDYFDTYAPVAFSTPIDTSKKLMPNNGRAVSQLEYSRMIGCLMYAMTCIRPDIAFVVGKLSRYTSNPSTQHWQAIQRIRNIEDNSSTSGWVFLLGGGAISWASKKQTCITGSTMKSEFVALAAAGKEAEWLKNLLLEIPLWSKPIAPISIRCDSAATLAKAYSQIYNGKSRHLCVRHSMIRELITNGVISIEFVRSR